jgi:hypothetical protein
MGFVAISDENGLAGLDGVLGLAPYSDSSVPSFVQKLYTDGQINKQVVSWQLMLQSASTPSTV